LATFGKGKKFDGQYILALAGAPVSNLLLK
jgi:hypothetical protein